MTRHALWHDITHYMICKWHTMTHDMTWLMTCQDTWQNMTHDTTWHMMQKFKKSLIGNSLTSTLVLHSTIFLRYREYSPKLVNTWCPSNFLKKFTDPPSIYISPPKIFCMKSTEVYSMCDNQINIQYFFNSSHILISPYNFLKTHL